MIGTRSSTRRRRFPSPISSAGTPPAPRRRRIPREPRPLAFSAAAILLALAATGPSLSSAPSTPVDPGEPRLEERRRYDDYPSAPLTLDESEFAGVSNRVMRQCGLPGDLTPDRAPWYFHYELGLEMIAQQDPQRALDSLVAATHKRQQSALSSRLYGMWYRDYLPYFHIARLHVTLGNVDCARDALERALADGSVAAKPELAGELETLKAELGLE